MALAFDAASSGTGTGTSITFSHVNAGNVLIVGVVGNPTGDAITGITYNGVALTKRATTTLSRVYEIWTLDNPSIGTFNIVVSFAGPAGDRKFCGAISLSGAADPSIGDTDASSASSQTSRTLTLTTTKANSWLVDCLFGENNESGLTIGADQTERVNITDSPSRFKMSTKPTTSIGNYDMTWSWTNSTAAGLAAVEIKAAGGGGAAPNKPNLLLLGVG